MNRIESGSVEQALATHNVELFMHRLRGEVEAPLCLLIDGAERDYRNEGRGLGRHKVLRRWLLNDPTLTDGDISNALGLLAEKVVQDVLTQVLPDLDVRLAPHDLAHPRNQRGRAGDIILGRRVVSEVGIAGDTIEPLAQIDVTISRRQKRISKMRRNRHGELKIAVIVLALAGIQYILNDGPALAVRDYLDAAVKPAIRAGEYPPNVEFAPDLVSVLDQEVKAVQEKFKRRRGVFPQEKEMLKKLGEVREILQGADYSRW